MINKWTIQMRSIHKSYLLKSSHLLPGPMFHISENSDLIFKWAHQALVVKEGVFGV